MRFGGYLPGFHPNSQKNLRRDGNPGSAGRPRSFARDVYLAIHARRLRGEGKRRIARALHVSPGLVRRVQQWAVAGTLLLLVSTSGFAQATVTSKLQWDQGAPDLVSAQAYTYQHYDDGSTIAKPFTGVTCTGASSPFVCSVAWPAFTPGSHTIALSATNSGGESPKSAALTFTFTVAVPVAPSGLRIGSLTPSSITVTFNDLTPPDRPLTGSYPPGILDWGSDATQWLLSGPYGGFSTNSISFSASGTSGTVAILNNGWLTSLRAFNGGSASATVTLKCPTSPDVVQSVGAQAVVTILTQWTIPCSPVTLSTSNGYFTNVDDLVVTSGA